MRPCDRIHCDGFPCGDVNHQSHLIPDIELDPERVLAVLISEAAPHDPSDYYYAPANPLFAQTTVQTFQDGGATVTNVSDILNLGIYLTTAVKCGKTGYSIATHTTKTCSAILKQELALFPHLQVLLLMGDVAIRAINDIAREAGQPRAIPAGSTYKIRGGPYHYQGIRALPSYLQAGPSFFIEKSKRQMIAQDIRIALDLIRS